MKEIGRPRSVTSAQFTLTTALNYGMTQYFVPLMVRDSFLVMVNASIHNERDLGNILASKNITLVKLPPYSYDFNPIELVFGSAKMYVKRWPELLRASMPFAIVNAFSQISLHSVQNACLSFKGN